MNETLISIAVVVYNSSKTVIETLDSIYNQTYQNIELIISDDCSKDDTMSKCRQWLDTHKERFKRVELLTVEKNSGVTANFSRAEKACHSDWVKSIAGDDVLFPHAIQTYVRFIEEHPNTVYVFSKVKVFGNDQSVVDYFNDNIFDYSFFLLPVEKQYEWLVSRRSQPIPAATTFYNKNKTQALGLFWDERVPMLEDWPRWIQCIEKQIHFEFIDQELVKYRLSETSICSGEVYVDSFRKSESLLFIYYQYKPSIKYVGRINAWARYVECQKMLSKNIKWEVLNVIAQILILPSRINRKFKKICKNY